MNATPGRLRLFVAAAVPPELLERVEAETRGLRTSLPGARWTSPDGRHITLKFLGSTSAEDLGSVSAAVAAAAARHRPARVALGDVGAFPSARRVRVLWLGIDDPARLLSGLAAGLDDLLGPLGYKEEKRAFTPHLTLARLKVPTRLQGPLPEVNDLGSWTVETVELFRSHLSPKGARYEVVSSYMLGEGFGEV